MSDTLKRAAAMLLAEANAIEDCHTRGDGDWTGEDEAKASHDAMREVAILLGEEAERMAEQAFFSRLRRRNRSGTASSATTCCACYSTSPASRSMLSTWRRKRLTQSSLTRSTRRTAAQCAG